MGGEEICRGVVADGCAFDSGQAGVGLDPDGEIAGGVEALADGDRVLDADAAAHAPAPTANAVFETPVSTHTVPTVPVIVNVNTCPSPSPAAALVHVNRVPDATLVTTGVG